MAKIYSFLRDVKEGERPVAPQARVILDTIAEIGPCTRPELIHELSRLWEQGVFVSKQWPANVVSHYQNNLLDRGLISLETVPKAHIEITKERSRIRADHRAEIAARKAEKKRNKKKS